MQPRNKLYGNAGTALSGVLRAHDVTNAAAARRLGVAEETLRGWIAGWSAPRTRSDVYRKLAELVGESAASQYEREVEVVRARFASDTESPEQFILRLIDLGRLSEAESGMRHAEGLDPTIATATYRKLGQALFDHGVPERGINCYKAAIELARDAEHGPERLIEELASRLTGAHLFAEGFRLLDEELPHQLNSATLWKRLAVLQWYNGDLLGAYASLTTVLELGADPPRVFHARGQVLAELGQWNQASAELKVAIDQPLTAMSQSYARSCLAYVSFNLGNHGEAQAEFERVRTIAPGNAWHWYRWGICRESVGDRDSASGMLSRALTLNGPALTPRQVEDAKRRLEEYN